MVMILRAAIVAFILPSSALAAEQILGRVEMDNVFVWKDEASFSEAVKLLEARVQDSNPELVFRLLSCIAAKGDKAVVTDGGFFSSTILVTSGEKSGCRGLVANEDLKN